MSAFKNFCMHNYKSTPIGKFHILNFHKEIHLLNIMLIRNEMNKSLHVQTVRSGEQGHNGRNVGLQ